MFPNMEVIISAIVGELASRSVSFVIQTCSKRTEPPPSTDEEKLERLQRLLLRVGAVVEDAEGRRITNEAMLQQLTTMRREMHRGQFALDTSRCRRAHDDKPISDHESGHRSSLAKRLRICSGGGGSSRSAVEELQRVLEGLETIIRDAAEFVQLSGRYPRLCRQPYSTYLLLDRFMFGRQMEREHIVNFLHQQEDAEQHLGVLPIVGPMYVGKSTLVEHVCIDERVRDHFSQIVFINGGDDLGNGTGVIRYGDRRQGSSGGGGRVLIVVEADRDIDEDSWRRLYSASKSRCARGSKIIVTSRSDEITGFGTTPPLRLRFLSPEAYWYFFKARIFGSMDVAREHPKLASVAMELAIEMNGYFTSTSTFRGILKSSLDLGTWNTVLSAYREFKQRNPLISDMNPVDPWDTSKPLLLPAVSRAAPGHSLIVNCYYQTSSWHGNAGGESFEVTVQDLMFGTPRPQGRFHALAWRSHIPPHNNHVITCEWRKPAVSAVSSIRKKKRIHKRRTT